MGIGSIQLYRFDDFERTRKLEEKYQRVAEKEIKKAGLTPEIFGSRKQQAIEKRVAQSLGLSEFGNDERGKLAIDMPSTKYPDNPHCRVGCFSLRHDDCG